MSFDEQIIGELNLIRVCTALAGVFALLNGEVGAAALASAVYWLVKIVERIFRHPAIVY